MKDRYVTGRFYALPVLSVLLLANCASPVVDEGSVDSVTMSQNSAGDVTASFRLVNNFDFDVCIKAPASTADDRRFGGFQVAALDRNGEVDLNGDPASAFGLDTPEKVTKTIYLPSSETISGTAYLLGDAVSLPDGESKYQARIVVCATACESMTAVSYRSGWFQIQQ